MPVTYLTAKDREMANERRCNDVLAAAVRFFKAKFRKPDAVLADTLGLGRATISRYKDPDVIGNITLNKARQLAHETKMSPDEWLAVGGFK